MFSKETYPFRLHELPYAYHALEPFIDQRTMYFHHDKHLKTYIDNLNKALKSYPEYQTWTLEELLTRLSELPEELRTPVRNNGGGVYNHEMYFHLMAPAGQPFSTEVAEAFGGEDNWKRQMKAAALGQFGSGFARPLSSPFATHQRLASSRVISSQVTPFSAISTITW